MNSKQEYPQNGKSESNDDSVDNQNAASTTKQKRKRRSKNEAEGRNFKCSDCGRSYLSQPALTNHKKTKHNYGAEGEKKGRGRPRKNPPNPISNDNTEKKFKAFFEKEIRKPYPNDSLHFEYSQECFKEIFGSYKNELFARFENYSAHSFYNTLQEIPIKAVENSQDGTNNPSMVKPSQDISCDQVFASYLKDVSTKTNKEYFYFIFKFVLLFRECINTVRKGLNNVDSNDKNLGKEFTQINNAENVPDTCNEFISEFMEPHDYFGLDTGELIEVIQHLCFWLYVHNFTTSRLTLL